MLGTGVQQEAGTGFDDAAEVQLAQALGKAAASFGEVRCKRVEVVDVEGEGDAVVA